MRYELGFYVREDFILHSHRRENLKSYAVYAKFNDHVYISDYVSLNDSVFNEYGVTNEVKGSNFDVILKYPTR
jgi:hypothetical protein